MEDLFSLQKKEVMPYEKFDNTWVSVTFEMDLSLITYERNVFTLFDMLSDIGGLSGILMTTFGVFTALWNYNAFDNMMASSLFKVTKTQTEMQSGKSTSTNSQQSDSSMDIAERSKIIKLSCA